MKMLVTSEIVKNTGKASLILKTTLSSLYINGCFPNRTLHTGSIILDKVERAESTELQPTPVLKYSVKYYISISVVA